MNCFYQTKILFLTIGILISIFCSIVIGNQKEGKSICENADNASTTLFLPIVFSYRDFSLRNEEIYNTLHPKLEDCEFIFWSERTPKETKFDPVSGKFAMHFCFSNWQSLNEPVTIKLRLGLTHLDISIKNSELSTEKKSKSKTIIHPPVMLVDQQSPDWLIPIRSRLSISPSGDRVIDFQIYNPSSKGMIGPLLSLIKTRPKFWSCAYAGPTYRSKVSFRLIKGAVASEGLEVVSTEPNYQDPIIRNVLIERNECTFGERITVSLGEVPSIKPDEIVRLIYKLSGAEILGTSFIRLKFMNTRIYPDNISLR